MDLIIPLWKPCNITSFKALRVIKESIKGVKVGHAGTLDPFAEGILIVCTGKKTKLVESLMSLKKEYYCRIKLGIETDTLDITGNKICISKIGEINSRIIGIAIEKFIGTIQQVPPKFSALKINGKRSYELARKGVEFSPMPRKVNIHSIKLIDYGKDWIDINVKCGRGTYIRSLARDLAYELNTCGYVEKLSRIKIGEYNEVEAIQMDEVSKWIHSNH